MVELYKDSEGYTYANVDGKIYRVVIVRVADLYDIAKTIVYEMFDFINNNERRKKVIDNVVSELDMDDIFTLTNVAKINNEPVIFNTSIGKYTPIIVDENCPLDLIHTNVNELIIGDKNG